MAAAADVYFDQFVSDHEGQLKHWHFPRSLYHALYTKLTQEIFDAGRVFTFAQVEDSDGHTNLEVYSSTDIAEG